MIGIDANLLIYAGIVPKKSKDNTKKLKDLTRRSGILFDNLQGNILAISSIALAEVLVPVSNKKKGKLISELSKRFVIADFTIQAATIASSLWAEHKKLPADEQYDKRIVLSADTKIIASLKAVGVSTMYSHDRKCRKIANLTMDAFDLPTHSEKLFEK